MRMVPRCQSASTEPGPVINEFGSAYGPFALPNSLMTGPNGSRSAYQAPGAIGSGAPANQSIQKMISGDEFGLGDWKLVESSEQAMLAEVGRAVKRQRWVVFLGWTPEPRAWLAGR